MVRPVLILDSLLSEKLESLQKSSAFETGLILAQIGSQADTVLRLISTPSNDEDGVASSGVDASWMVAHAGAVSHMLPGGIAVLGAYLFSPSAKFSALEAKMRPVLASALKQLKGVDEAQALLLLLPTDARKASARVLAANSPNAKPLELKTTSTAPQLHCLETTWRLNAELHLGATGPQLSQLRKQLAPVLASLEAAAATIGGACPASGASFAQLASRGPQQPHQVRLFGALASLEEEVRDDDEGEEGGGGGGADAAVATVRLCGVVRGRAFASAKDSVADGLRRLREDLAKTLERRVSLLIEEMAEEDGADARAPLPTGGAGAWALPRRAHFDIGGELSLCDYVAEGEDASDFVDKATELLGQSLTRSIDGLTQSQLEALLAPEAAGEASLAPQKPPGAREATPAAAASNAAPAPVGAAAAQPAKGATAAASGPSGAVLAAIGVATIALVAAAVMAMSGVTEGGRVPVGATDEAMGGAAGLEG